MKRIIIVFFVLVFSACADDPLPKPKAYLRLDYPKAVYNQITTPLPFTLEKNRLADRLSKVKITGKSKGINIRYPSLKATIYLNYNEVSENNLENLLRDAQNLTQKHTMKADEITYKPFENAAHKVYGMLYEIGGNAASQSQFYVTDSTNHFLSGSLYFYAQPNYDSIYPASEYLKKDIKRIMESVRWKNKE